MPSQIEITRPLATHLLGLAQKSPDKKICGLVAQLKQKPSTVYPILNISQIPEQQCTPDSKQLNDAKKIMLDKNESLFAIYHTHLQDPSELSKDYIHQNFQLSDGQPPYHLIISLDTKGVLEMQAYCFEGNQIQAVNLTV